MAGELVGRWKWIGTREPKQGHREYTIVHKVRTTDSDDGPKVVSNTPGLPRIGSIWRFGNDLDPWAFCTPFMEVKQVSIREGQPLKDWEVTQKFVTIGGSNTTGSCEDLSIGNPLLEPPEISGSFINDTKLVSVDRDNNAILSSSHELIEVEKDNNRPTVIIKQNRPILQLAKMSEFMNTVNKTALWGLGANKIKLNNASWRVRYHANCSIFYERVLEFDIDFDEFKFDRIVDKGTKQIRGDWVDRNNDPTNPDWRYVVAVGANRLNPSHFVRARDQSGTVLSEVLLDNDGEPSTIGPQYISDKFLYKQSNFLELGIPTNLEGRRNR